jgi:hypothetical protein
MRLAPARHRPAAPARTPAEAEPDLDTELRELLLAEYAQPVLIVLPGAAFLVRPVRRRRSG